MEVNNNRVKSNKINISDRVSPRSVETWHDSKTELKKSIELLTATATDLRQACLTLSSVLVKKLPISVE